MTLNLTLIRKFFTNDHNSYFITRMHSIVTLNNGLLVNKGSAQHLHYVMP